MSKSIFLLMCILGFSASSWGKSSSEKKVVSVTECMATFNRACFVVGANCKDDDVQKKQIHTCGEQALASLAEAEKGNAPQFCATEKLKVCNDPTKSMTFSYQCFWSDAVITHRNSTGEIADTSKMNKKGQCFKYFQSMTAKYYDEFFTYNGKYALEKLDAIGTQSTRGANKASAGAR